MRRCGDGRAARVGDRDGRPDAQATPWVPPARTRSTVTTVEATAAGSAARIRGALCPFEGCVTPSDTAPTIPRATARASRSPRVPGLTAPASGPKDTAMRETPYGQTRSWVRTVPSMFLRTAVNRAVLREATPA